jgi:hypothetical protein
VVFKVLALAALALVASAFISIGGLLSGALMAVVDFGGILTWLGVTGNGLSFPPVNDSNVSISEATPVDGKSVVAVVVVVGVEGLGTVVPEGPTIEVGVLVDTDVDLVPGDLVVAADAKALTAALFVDVVLFVGVILFPQSGPPPETGGFPRGFDASTSTQMPAPTSDVRAITREMFI